jgi:hypothetical protein
MDPLGITGILFGVGGSMLTGGGVCGDLTGVRGDLTGVRGELTGVRGNLTGVRGNLTGVRGNLQSVVTGGMLSEHFDLNIHILRCRIYHTIDTMATTNNAIFLPCTVQKLAT